MGDGEENKEAEAKEEGEPDPEEEERQRRAALAARMARLGGARVGMGPPIFGRKPDVPPKKIQREEPKVVEEEVPKPVEDQPKRAEHVDEETAATKEEVSPPVAVSDEAGSQGQ